MKTPQNVQRVGIMFASDADGHYPTVGELAYDPDDRIANWFVIAYDPRPLMYGDEDSEAMDSTNFAALVDAMGTSVAELLTLDRYASSDRYETQVAELLTTGVGLVDLGHPWGRALVIAPVSVDDVDRWDGDVWVEQSEAADRLTAAHECERALSNYPLLDEDAYSELEWEAWQQYVSDGLRFDTCRTLGELIDDDDETACAIDGAWDEVAPAAGQYLHYWSGFTGEHGPDFTQCIGEAIATALGRLFVGGEV